MKRLAVTLAFSLLVVTAAPGQEQTGNKERIRARQPSVVSVEGRSDPVAEDREPRNRSVPGKIGGGIKSGAVWTGKSILRLTGWMLGSENTISGERQRKAESGSKEESK